MKNVNYLINEIKGLDGATVEIFGQTKILEAIEDKAIINVCDFLENLRGFECEQLLPVYDEDIEEYEEKIIEDKEEFFNSLKNDFGLKEITCDNTYNYMSPIDHDINFYVYECSELDKIYVDLSVHKYGDIRGNYTDSVILEFDGISEFDEYFYHNENAYKYLNVEINGKFYGIDLNMWSDTKDITDSDGNYLFYSCETELNDIIEDIKEQLK